MRFYDVAKAATEVPRVTMMLYGATGAGKTHFAAGAGKIPELSPVLYIDLDNGARTIIERVRQDGEKLDVFVVDQIKSLVDLERALRITKTPDDRPFKTIVLDTITTFQTLDQVALVEERGVTRPEIAEFGTDTFRCKALGLKLLQSDLNFLILATVRVDNGVTRPDLTLRVAEGLPGMVDVLAHLRLNTKKIGKDVVTERILEVEGTQHLRAKTRFRMGTLHNPTFEKMWDAILGKESGKEQQERDKKTKKEK